MGTARVICETESTVAIYAPAARPRREECDPLVVTFPSMTSRIDGVRFWQDEPLRRAGVSAIGLMCKHPHWFTRQEMALLLPSLLPIIARHKPARIVTWGYSLGATPALMHGCALGADLSAALSPHYSIDPAIIGDFDGRRKRTFDPKLHGDFKIEAEDLSPLPIIFYDPLFAWDREHARRIEALSPRLQRVLTPGLGHYTSSPFLVTEAASASLVDLLVHGSAETFVRAARNLVRSFRKLTPDYHQELGAALLAHRRGKLALQSATRALELQPRNARRRIFLAELQATLAGSPAQSGLDAGH